ncbi:MAG: hypothetical protein V6S10_07670 [Candidatus Methanoglobus sp.]|jgi:2,4-dienoyl-CoA reductase-like NADH-dependent reductase (Old Yellow Enzyme family)
MRVFTPFESKDLRLKNKIVRSATAEAMAEDRFLTPPAPKGKIP